MREFVDFAKQVFPSIDPYEAENVKDAISQFNEQKPLNLLKESTISGLNQGDFFTNVPFLVYNNKGEIFGAKHKAILLSNTCDASRKDNLIFAPLLPLGSFVKKSEIKNKTFDVNKAQKNEMYNLLYFHDQRVGDYLIDFNHITSINREFFLERLHENKSAKSYSLNQTGYYLLLTKLTIHFMRPEDPQVQQTRTLIQ